MHRKPRGSDNSDGLITPGRADMLDRLTDWAMRAGVAAALLPVALFCVAWLWGVLAMLRAALSFCLGVFG